jgi:FkbM family methyltransferase
MKKIIYSLINKLGFSISNKKKLAKLNLNYFLKFNLTGNLDILVKSKKTIENIEKFYNDLIIKNYKLGFIFEFENLKIYIESSEEIYIINEIFVEKDYNFHSNKKCTVIDIGANVGIASLFFSTLKHVSNIYAFEPVQETFAQAQLNFELNQKICKVERNNNFGLGNSNKIENFIYNRSSKGNTGIRGKLSSSYFNSTNLNTARISVNIKNAQIEIKKLIEINRNNLIVVKIDCEGAEFEIFQNLDESKTLSEIDIIFIEWHDKGPQEIEKCLERNGFNFFSRNLTTISGIIYAYKK